MESGAFSSLPATTSPGIQLEWSAPSSAGTGTVSRRLRESAKTQIVIRAVLLHALAYPQPHRSYSWSSSARRSERRRRSSRSAAGGVVDAIRALVEKVGGFRLAPGAVLLRAARKNEAYGKGAAVRGPSWGRGARTPSLSTTRRTRRMRGRTVTEADWDWFLSDVYFLGQSSRIFLIGNNPGERIVECLPGRSKGSGRCDPHPDAEGRSANGGSSPPSLRSEEFSRLGKLISGLNKMCECIDLGSQKFRKRHVPILRTRSGPTALYLHDCGSGHIEEARRGLQRHRDGGRERRRAIVCAGRRVRGATTRRTMDAIFSAAEVAAALAGIEAVAYQSALQHFLEKEMPKRGHFPHTAPEGGEEGVANRRSSRASPWAAWFRRTPRGWRSWRVSSWRTPTAQ